MTSVTLGLTIGAVIFTVGLGGFLLGLRLASRIIDRSFTGWSD